VYSAFSSGVVAVIWSQISVGEVIFLVVLSAVLVVFMLFLTRITSERLGINRADTIAAEFCGSKKSLATGRPMASVMFASGGTPLGLLIWPLRIYHHITLLICSWLAARYGKETTARAA